jgi:CubicO group peptidase (beta-lactamase class C family)
VTATKQDLTIFKRDDINNKITIKDADGNAVDITGYTLYFTVKPDTDDDSGSDTTAVIAIVKSTYVAPGDDPTNGVAYLTLANTSTVIAKGNYYYDLRVSTGAGKGQTLFYGRYCIKQDITEEI